jgi:hypothetical protein
LLRAALADEDRTASDPFTGLPALSPRFRLPTYGEGARSTALAAEDLFLVRSLLPDMSLVTDLTAFAFFGFDLKISLGRDLAGLSPLVFCEKAGKPIRKANASHTQRLEVT